MNNMQNNNMQNNASNSPLSDKVKHVAEGIAKGEDKAIDQVAPKRTFALVALTYPLVLIGAIFLFFLCLQFLER